MDDEREEVESRFAHLLQPLRNLADNWNIDIASELEEYLNELESITFSFDGLGKSLNFAEAALLIQGSTIIYSKKVEYLYTLLYQTLDFLIEKRKKNQKSDASGGLLIDGEDGGAADDVEDEFREEEAEFLTLDDLPEANNIDLDESSDSNRLRINLTKGATPLALLSLGDDGTSDGTKKTDFRMNTCAVHSSGALLLEDERRLRDDTFKVPSTSEYRERGVSLGGDRLLETGGGVLLNMDRSLDSSDDEDNEDIDPEGKDKSKEGEKESDEKGAENKKAGEEETKNKEEEDERSRQVLEVRVDPQDKGKEKVDGEKDGEAVLGNNAREKQRRNVRDQSMRGDKEEEEDEEAIRERLFNLWATMDPHSNQGIRPAPFKKGKTYRVPPSLADEQSKSKGKGQKNEVEPKHEGDDEANEAIKDEETDMNGPSLFKVKGPYLPEFNYLYLKEMKRRAKERKKEKDLRQNKRKSLAPTNGDVELAVEYVEEPEVIDAIEKIASNAGQLEPSHVQAALASTSGLPLPGLGDDAEISSDEEDMGWNAEPMAFDEDAVHRNATQPNIDELIDDGQILQSYEDLCRKHIENYLTSAQAFAVETALTKRVADWRAKLEPILSRQEEAKPFDIHSYGENMITRFHATPTNKNPVSTFEDLLVEEEDNSSEICRLFAATLQLANHGNVEIIPDVQYTDDVEDESTRMDIKGSFKLKLLSSTLVTFETNNNINIAVLKKKIGEGDESEENHEQPKGRKGAKASKRKRKQTKDEGGEEEEGEDEMVVSDEEPTTTSRTVKNGKTKPVDKDEEDDDIEEEEEEMDDDRNKENSPKSVQNVQKGKSNGKPGTKKTTRRGRGKGSQRS